MTKFLIVVHYFAPHIGGMEAVAKKQAHSLRQRGHDVTVVTARPDRSAPLRETTDDGVEIYRLRALNFIETKFGVTFPIVSPTAFFTLLRLVGRADIVHIHDVFYMTSHFAGLASLLKKKRFFLTQHVAFVDFPNKLVMFVQALVYNTFGNLLFRRAAHVVCYNKNVETFLLQRGVPAKRLTLTYNGIDTEYFQPVSVQEKQLQRARYGLPENLPVVLFVGRLVPKKGYDIVAAATSENYHVLIVGGEDSAKKRSRDGVTFFGSAQGDVLRDLYQLSDVFAFPASGEMFTLTQQEAMACGLAQVTAENPGYDKYALNHDLFAFVERTSDALRRRLESIIDQSEHTQEMGRYARELAEDRFDWNRNYQTEYAIYEGAVS